MALARGYRRTLACLGLVLSSIALVGCASMRPSVAVAPAAPETSEEQAVAHASDAKKPDDPIAVQDALNALIFGKAEETSGGLVEERPIRKASSVTVENQVEPPVLTRRPASISLPFDTPRSAREARGSRATIVVRSTEGRSTKRLPDFAAAEIPPDPTAVTDALPPADLDPNALRKAKLPLVDPLRYPRDALRQVSGQPLTRPYDAGVPAKVTFVEPPRLLPSPAELSRPAARPPSPILEQIARKGSNGAVLKRPPPDRPAMLPEPDSELMQAACKGCNGGLLGRPHTHSSWPPTHGGGGCVPGRELCCPHEADTYVGRVFGGIYDCVCCPDPCYEPRWIAAADASFFADAPRPVTQTRLRADWGIDLLHPDRAEYFWARSDVKTGLASGGPCPRPNTPRGPGCAERSVYYRDVAVYTEAAIGKIGAFVEIPYRRVDAELCPCDYSGFTDMNFGTKSLVLDCELLQISFQFRTFMPVGIASKGLGTGHVALEPSLLWALHVATDTYIQAQTSYRIPIAGDQVYAGDVFHYHVSLNQVLCRPYSKTEMIGTLEVSGWSFLDGMYTDPDLLVPDPDNPTVLLPSSQPARGHLMAVGAGLRFVLCDLFDVGVGALYAVTDDHLAREFYRLEIRTRF